MAGHDDEEPGFWPGYVGAVSGLVQGLLITAMALGISIIALGQIAKLPRRPQPSAAPVAVTSSALQTSPQPPLQVGSGFANRPQTAQQQPQPEVRPAKPPEKAYARLTIGFLDDAIILPKSSAAAISDAVSRRLAAGAKRWRIHGATDLGDPRLRRMVYLRLLSVRESLLKSGVRANQIDVELVALAPGETANDNVEVLPLDAAGWPLILSGEVR